MAKLSIIIPACNMRAQLERCLLTIQRTVRLPYEVIVIDDGSSDDQRIGIPPSGGDVRILRSETQRGFSHAVNSGIRASSGEVLLFLHADIMLAPHTAEDMLDALIDSPRTGAVTASAPRTYGRAEVLPSSDYQSWEAFVAAAEEIRMRTDGAASRPDIISEMFALMVRRDVVAAAGFLDESYAVPALAAYDYTVRMTRAGYGIAVLPRVYVHHDESTHGQDAAAYDELRQRERQHFRAKWGLSLDYSFNARCDLLSLMNLTRDGLHVLEIGCACGATLREIGSRNPTVHLCGVEMNEKAAVLAAPFAKIITMNVEDLDPADISERFDYIIMGDVIEHLVDPWAAVRNMHDLLAPGGFVIASIPNVSHARVLFNLLRGFWSYQDQGLLDRTHLRFFTKHEILRLFTEAGFSVEDIRWWNVDSPAIIGETRDELLSLKTVSVSPDDLDAYQYFVKARRI